MNNRTFCLSLCSHAENQTTEKKMKDQRWKFRQCSVLCFGGANKKNVIIANYITTYLCHRFAKFCAAAPSIECQCRRKWCLPMLCMSLEVEQHHLSSLSLACSLAARCFLIILRIILSRFHFFHISPAVLATRQNETVSDVQHQSAKTTEVKQYFYGKLVASCLVFSSPFICGRCFRGFFFFFFRFVAFPRGSGRCGWRA